jgi:hypothetical protein
MGGGKRICVARFRSVPGLPGGMPVRFEDVAGLYFFLFFLQK